MIANTHNNHGTMADGYIFRPATWDDLEGVTDLLNAWSKHYLGFDEFTAKDQKREWETPKFIIQESTQVAVSPEGKVVGYYEIWDLNDPPVRVNLWGRIHPEHEGKGLGTRLLEWGIRRAKRALDSAPPEARVSLGMETLSLQADAQVLFENHGFKLVRHFLRMTIDMDTPPIPLSWPHGITVRSMVRGQDERKVVQAFRDSFRDHWGYIETPFEDTYERWVNYIDDNPDFDPDLWFIAEENGIVAGISLCWKKSFGDPNLGWVGTLGVLRPWRRRGLALALLRHSFLKLYERGQRRVGLGVDAQSLTGAMKLYEKAGMYSDLKHQMSFFELELRDGIEMSTQSVEN